MDGIVKVGTSGYNYFWNEGKPSPFEWYIKQNFKTVEINASFYRFPSTSWVECWMKAPKDFDFSIKVHRSLTHVSRLGERAVELWSKFIKPLSEMIDKISFWLFQMPPSFLAKQQNLERIKVFFKRIDAYGKFVIEFRHPSWWGFIDEIESCGLVFCSVDCPELPNDMVVTNDVLYLRMHGREEWYSYVYSEEELEDIARRIKAIRASRKYIYFNNDHGMLENAKRLMELLES